MPVRSLSRLVVAAGLLALPATLAAQAEFGIKGGASFGDISNKGLLPGDLDNRTGFAAGVSLGMRARAIGLGVEALYAQRGVTASDAVAGDDLELDYIDIPVYLKLQVPTPGVSPFAYVGPQISFEMRCRNVDVDCVDGSRETTDYAGIVGAGLKLGNETGLGFTVEARYIYGLRDLNPSTITDDDSFKTRSFLILGGILF